MFSFGHSEVEEILCRGFFTEIENESYDSENDDSYQFINDAYPCSYFFFELRHLVSRVTTRISIEKLELKNKEFYQLVGASKQAKKLEFTDCNIFTDSQFDFGPMEECQIEKIKICNLILVYKNWIEYENSLMDIF